MTRERALQILIASRPSSPDDVRDPDMRSDDLQIAFADGAWDYWMIVVEGFSGEFDDPQGFVREAVQG